MKKIIALILALFMCLSPFGVFAEDDSDVRGFVSAHYIKTIIDVIAEDYRFGADKEAMYRAVLDYVMNEHPELLEGSIKAVTDTLDDYSDYLTSAELNEFYTSVENSYVGIGVTVQSVPEGLLVSAVNETGGAHAAGILVGDIIFEADGHNMEGLSLDEGRALILGDADTVVSLKVRRGDRELSVNVTRKKIYVETVAYTVTEEGIGYIVISEFAPTTPDSVKAALKDLESSNVKKFIIDVRSNPGGTLESAVKTLELFVPKGKRLTKIEYNDTRYSREIKSNATFTKAPKRDIVILINEYSASAAELFSGVMQNLKLAKLVGEDSYGKGSMQEFMLLNSPLDYNLGDIKLSVAEFTKPDGTKINGVGIKPDAYVKNPVKNYEDKDFTEMGFNKKYTVGDSAKDILAIEERLLALGYFDGVPDESFDEETKIATQNFQADLDLHPYGVMDFTTQQAVKNEVKKVEYIIDEQLMKALSMLK